MIQETSLKAFEEILPTLSDRHQKVLKVLCTVENASNSELAQMLNWSVNRITPRIFELRESGLVEEAMRRRCRQTGRTVIAWRVKRRTVQGTVI